MDALKLSSGIVNAVIVRVTQSNQIRVVLDANMSVILNGMNVLTVYMEINNG